MTQKKKRFTLLFKKAVKVLGSSEEARNWFIAPNHALGGLTPFEYADTKPGTREIEDLLGRIEHGVFA